MQSGDRHCRHGSGFVEGYPVLLQDGRVLAKNSLYSETGVPLVAAKIAFAQAMIPERTEDPIPVVITGTEFLPNSIVFWNGSSVVSIFLGSGKLVAFLPADVRAKQDLGTITVRTMAGETTQAGIAIVRRTPTAEVENDDAGKPLTITLNGESQNSFRYSIAAGAQTILSAVRKQ